MTAWAVFLVAIFPALAGIAVGYALGRVHAAWLALERRLEQLPRHPFYAGDEGDQR